MAACARMAGAASREDTLKAENALLVRQRHALVAERDADWHSALRETFGVQFDADTAPRAAARLVQKLLEQACDAIDRLEEQNAALLGDILDIVERLRRSLAAPADKDLDWLLGDVTCKSLSFDTAPDCAACTKRHVERERLPGDRTGRTFKLRIGNDEKLCETCGAPLPGSRVSGHLTVNAYPDGRPGELFLALDRARRGDLAATFGHQLAIAISIGLQHGVPLAVYASRMRHVRDESGGTVMHEVAGKMVPNENPRTVGSLIDLIAATLQRCEEPAP